MSQNKAQTTQNKRASAVAVGGRWSVVGGRWLAIVLAVSSIGFALASIALRILNGAGSGPEQTPAPDDVAMAALFPPVGLLIALYRPNNRIGWLCVLVGLAGSLAVFSPAYAIYALFTNPGVLPGGALMSWLNVWVWSLGWVGIALLVSLFPTGHLRSRRWAWPVVIEAVAVLIWIIVLGGGLWPHRGPLMFATEPPEEMQQAFVLFEQLAMPLFLTMVLALLASAVGAVLRFRQSRGVERQQMKWFVLTVAFTAFGAGITFFFELNTQLADPFDQLAYAVEVLAFGSGPVAIGIAILRYRLYDIDIIVRGALLYATLTAMLGLLYFGSVVLLQQLFRVVSGQESDLAIIVSTLVIAALFNPLRERIQAAIDRRFYRRKYDATTMLATFSLRLRDEVDLNALTEDLLAVADETLQPAHLSLWLTRVGERGE
jgi:hypothetical protein